MLLQVILQSPGHAYCVSHITSDNGGSRQRSIRKMRDFQSPFAIHTDWTEALLWMFVYFSVSHSSNILPPPPWHGNSHFLFLYFWHKKCFYIDFWSMNRIISYCSKWAHIILASNHQPVCIISRKKYCYTPSADYSDITHGMKAQGVALYLITRVRFPSRAGTFHLEFMCSPCVYVGFLRVRQFLLPSKHVSRSTSSRYPWLRYWLRMWSQSQSAALWLPTDGRDRISLHMAYVTNKVPFWIKFKLNI